MLTSFIISRNCSHPSWLITWQLIRDLQDLHQRSPPHKLEFLFFLSFPMSSIWPRMGSISYHIGLISLGLKDHFPFWMGISRTVRKLTKYLHELSKSRSFISLEHKSLILLLIISDGIPWNPTEVRKIRCSAVGSVSDTERSRICPQERSSRLNFSASYLKSSKFSIWYNSNQQCSILTQFRMPGHIILIHY